jgi:hypothetical protein
MVLYPWMNSMQEIYDFEEAESKKAVVENSVEVSVYLGSKVGVLGGGVELGRPKPSIEAKDQLVADAREEAFESDSEDDAEITYRYSPLSIFVWLFHDTDAPPLSLSDLPSPVGPTMVELPPSPTESDLTPTSFSRISINPPEPISSSTFPLSKRSSFSWADNEEDDSYFDEIAIQ